MSKKQKLYIPLIRNGRVQLVNCDNIKGLSELIPSSDRILKHLIDQREKSERIDDYNRNLPIMSKRAIFTFEPIVVKVEVEKFDNFEKQLKRLKPDLVLFHKAFDLISDSLTKTPIVQFSKI